MRDGISAMFIDHFVVFQLDYIYVTIKPARTVNEFKYFSPVRSHHPVIMHASYSAGCYDFRLIG